MHADGQRRKHAEVFQRIAMRVRQPVGPIGVRAQIGLGLFETPSSPHLGKTIDNDRYPQQPGEECGECRVVEFR